MIWNSCSFVQNIPLSGILLSCSFTTVMQLSGAQCITVYRYALKIGFEGGQKRIKLYAVPTCYRIGNRECFIITLG